MMNTTAFDSVKKHFGYGLVKLSADLKIIDKNIKAESFRVFPRRGANVRPVIENGKKRLTEMSDKLGDNAIIEFQNGINRVNAFAIRDFDGGIMLLLHPLISTASLGRGGKMPKSYAINILKIIYEENLENNFSGNEFISYESTAIKRPMLIATVVKSLSEKLKNTNFKNLITFDFDCTRLGLSLAVDFNTVIYALTEILALENTFSNGKSAKIDFVFTEETLDITLNAVMKKKDINDGRTLSRLFSEALLLFGISAFVKFTRDGFIFAKASVNLETAGSTAREPAIFFLNSIWGYFDYSMDYYALGEE